MERTNDQYHDEIRKVATKALREGVDSFEELCQNCMGAWPDTIHALVQDGPYADVVAELAEVTIPRKDVSVFKDGPDPSPTDYEWRFTKSTANELAEVIKAHGGKVLCLGTPTVFWALKAYKQEVVLVDRNPYILDLVNETGMHRVHILDLHLKRLPYAADHFDVVIFDAPWYLDHLHYWLSLANKHVKPNGLVLFPMFRQLVKPSAVRDRAILNAYATTAGTVTDAPEVVYETPKFEDEALSALGLFGLQEWRVADLIRIEIPGRKINMNAPRLESGAWERFRFANEVVALRPSIEDLGPIRIRSPYNDGSFVLRTVSARSKERSRINFWTSSNRVAVIDGLTRVHSLLSTLEREPDKISSLEAIITDPNELAMFQRLYELISPRS